MSIKFKCPQCRSAMKVSESMAGRRIRCPDCDEMVEVPVKKARRSKKGKAGKGEPSNGSGLDAWSLEGDEVQLEPAATPPEPPERLPAETPAAAVPPAPPKRSRFDTSFETPGELGGYGGYDDDDYDEDDYEDDYDEEDEAPALGPKKELAEGEMDMTPMVDVTFLLLIFFMVTAAFSLQKSIQIPKPDQTDEPSTNVVLEPDESPDIVTLQIDEYNTFTVLTSDWEKEAAGEIDLIARLREARQGNDDGIVPSELLVKAHGKALHFRVVMALDAGSETGFEDVQLMTVDGEF